MTIVDWSKLPEPLMEALLPFQREGVSFAVEKNGRCLIADEMGLGKTLQAISAACMFRNEWPLLVIVPSCVKYCWIEEIEKWLPDILPQDINLIQSGADASGIADSPISIVTYGLLRIPSAKLIQETIRRRKFQVVICDESHYLKNTKTLSSRIIVPIIKMAKRRILLSGTPALARPVELYPQLDAVCPGKWDTFWKFTERYCEPRYLYYGGKRQRKVDGASNLEELQQRMSGMLMIRREKSQVLTELPPKQRQRVLFELKDSSLKKDISKRFDSLRQNIHKGNRTFQQLANSMESLADDHHGNGGPASASAQEDDDGLAVFRDVSSLYRMSGEAKIGPVREYIEMLCENEDLKFLVFAYHHNMMDGVEQALHTKKVRFVRIDGHTKPVDRQAYVSQFQSDPSTRVAILSILAAGVGLTLTSAKLVVFAELYWTPGVMVQCEDRAHRIGQTGRLSVHYLVAKNTMDEWVWSSVCKKITVRLAECCSHKGLSALSRERVASYFKDLHSLIRSNNIQPQAIWNMDETGLQFSHKPGKAVVTSTALTGKCRKLEHGEGDQHQIDVLSKADAWIPQESDEADVEDVGQLIKSQRQPDQPSILDFLSSQRRQNISSGPEYGNINNGGIKKTIVGSHSTRHGHLRFASPMTKIKAANKNLDNSLIVIDSDEEAEEFKSAKKKRRKVKGSSIEAMIDEMTEKKKENCESSSRLQNIRKDGDKIIAFSSQEEEDVKSLSGSDDLFSGKSSDSDSDSLPDVYLGLNWEKRKLQRNHEGLDFNTDSNGSGRNLNHDVIENKKVCEDFDSKSLRGTISRKRKLSNEELSVTGELTSNITEQNPQLNGEQSSESEQKMLPATGTEYSLSSNSYKVKVLLAENSQSPDSSPSKSTTALPHNDNSVFHRAGKDVDKLDFCYENLGSENQEFDGDKSLCFTLKTSSLTPLKGNQQIQLESENPNQWPCSMCTFLNHQDLGQCEICDTPKKMKTRNKNKVVKKKNFIASPSPGELQSAFV